MSAASLLQSLTEFGKDAETEYDTIADLPADALAILLAGVRDCRADLAALYKRIETDLLHEAGVKRFLVEGMGEVEIKKSTKRTGWDNDGLTRRVVALALDERILDETTGEYEPAWEAVARVLSECSRPSWRTVPLRSRGIQVDEFCHEEPDGYNVRLPPRQT